MSSCLLPQIHELRGMQEEVRRQGLREQIPPRRRQRSRVRQYGQSELFQPGQEIIINNNHDNKRAGRVYNALCNR